MNSIHFHRSESGIGMECNVAGVKISATEAPDGIHLWFTRCTPRTATQFDVKAPASASACQIAALIVKNLESVFPDIAEGKKA